MKKVMAVLIAFVLMLGVAACGETAVVSSHDTESKAPESSLETSSETVSEEETIPPLDEGIELKVPLLDRDLSQETRVKILPLGDSFTAFSPAAYRFYLYEMLYKNGNFFEFVGTKSSPDTRFGDYYARFEGTGGHTSVDGLKVYNEKIKGKVKYDIMVLMYGGNDVGTNDSKLPEFKKNYSALLDAIMADNPTATIFAVGWSYEGVANTVKEVVELYKTKGLDIVYVNAFHQEGVMFADSDYVQHTVERRHMLDSGNYKFAEAVFNAINDKITELNKVVPEKASRVPVAATNVNFDKTSLEVKIGESIEIGYEILPKTADTKSVIWHSSDESVATVSEYGLVTGVSTGETNITAISLDGKAYNVCKVSVSDDKFFVPTVDGTEIFSDDFSTADNWDNTAPITSSHNKSVSFGWNDKTLVTLSTNSAFDIPENFTLTFTHAQGNSVKDETKVTSITVGDYKLVIYNSSSSVKLYQNGNEIDAYEGRMRPFVNYTFTLTVKDGKVYVARDNIMMIEADVTPTAKNGKVVIESNLCALSVAEFDNITITK